MLKRTLVHARALLLAAAALGVGPPALHAVEVVLRDRVYGGQTNTHNIGIGLRDNLVTVTGDGDTDLDCWIYDPSGRLTDSDTDSTDYCVLSTPGVGVHRLVIKNYGRVYNAYVVRRE